MKGTRANEKLFWNNRARNYPRPFEKETFAKTGRILRLLGGMGIDFKGRRVLDIGCGTGVYALRLAGQAEKTLGVDSSQEMLKLFRAERRRRGINNASCIQSTWAALPAARLAGRFHIALASMTMAVKTRADIRKMEAAAAACVYIGWAGVRRNALLEKVYAKHGVAYRAPQGAETILKLLGELGREPAVRFIRDSWIKKNTPAETMRDIEVGLKVNGAKMDREWVAALLQRMTRKGRVRQVTSVRKALITWRVP
ncbi:MAG TPA: class I SAM-dependent methyltransferase [Elusimicrobiales bacterium]|nr:class I SAM-dependent methyltransferase [Elusimicrobiales bacterium]